MGTNSGNSERRTSPAGEEWRRSQTAATSGKAECNSALRGGRCAFFIAGIQSENSYEEKLTVMFSEEVAGGQKVPDGKKGKMG